MAQALPTARIGQPTASRSLRIFIKRYAIAYVLVLPVVLARLAFTLIPVVQTFWWSFTDKTFLGPQPTWVGLLNYADMLKDPSVSESLDFTVIYTVASTLLSVLLGLGIALLLNQKLRGLGIAQMVILLPWGTAPIVAGIMWRLMFFEAGGVLNDLVLRFHLSSERVLWLSDAGMARVSVIVTTLWKNTPWCILLLLAGLRTVPKDLYEAAEMDGAGVLAQFRHVTMPLMMPVILVVLMLRGMGEVQTFGQIFGLTRGGPGDATRIISLAVFHRFFVQLQFGYGSAIAIVLLILTAAIGGGIAWPLYRSRRQVR